MNLNQARLDSLVERPSESLNVEIKRWIDPESPAGIAKIAKGALAIRNRNGGYLVIGFDDQTLLPDQNNAPSDVRASFSVDKIQGIVSRYSSEIFEIGLGFGRRDGIEFPIIGIPEGVTAPVAAKRDLKDRGQSLMILGEVYFRTLNSNGTPSTSKARPNDWRDIVDICFENREADIGRFLRRHLGSEEAQQFVQALAQLPISSLPRSEVPPPSLRDTTKEVMEKGAEFYRKAIAEKTFEPADAKYLDALAWSVSLKIEPPHEDAMNDRTFLNRFSSANPQYTGWPVWLDSRGFIDEEARPRMVQKAWQALIVSFKGWSRHLDFMRMDAKGEFYLRRLLQDDLSDDIPRGKFLDPVLMVYRLAEAIAVGISIARALEWESDAHLGFEFRWDHLKGRNLETWATPLIGVPPSYGQAHDDVVESFVEVPIATPLVAITPHVHAATRDLFLCFDGYSVPMESMETLVRRLVERKL